MSKLVFKTIFKAFCSGLVLFLELLYSCLLLHCQIGGEDEELPAMIPIHTEVDMEGEGVGIITTCHHLHHVITTMGAEVLLEEVALIVDLVDRDHHHHLEEAV